MLAVERPTPIHTEDYPTKARRPSNSRLDLGRWRMPIGETPPHWQTALTTVHIQRFQAVVHQHLVDDDLEKERRERRRTGERRGSQMDQV
jgi:hypothetical protein